MLQGIYANEMLRYVKVNPHAELRTQPVFLFVYGS